MTQDNNTLSVYAHNGEIIGHINVFPSPRNNSLWGSRGEVRRFTIREGRRRLLHEWDHWSQLVLRSPQNQTRQASVAIVAFPTGRDGEGYLRFL